MQSKPRHSLTRLREILGLRQGQMASLGGCSIHTVRSIEQRKQRISERLAAKLADETWIDPIWLRNGDAEVIPLSVLGIKYTKQQFEMAQCIAFDPLGLRSTQAKDALKKIIPRLEDLLNKAASLGKLPVTTWKVGKMLHDLEIAIEEDSRDSKINVNETVLGA
jgi:transcriptional regulator with XRE-family HTH domain